MPEQNPRPGDSAKSLKTTFRAPPAQVGAFERGEMNLTIGSLVLLAQTLRVKVVELMKGLED